MDRASIGMELESPCGPEAPCRAKLEAMEVAHQKELQELQEKHAKELKELEEQKDRLLQGEIQTAAKGKAELRLEKIISVQKSLLIMKSSLQFQLPR